MGYRARGLLPPYALCKEVTLIFKYNLQANFPSAQLGPVQEHCTVVRLPAAHC